jgi:hypothetical protein
MPIGFEGFAESAAPASFTELVRGVGPSGELTEGIVKLLGA